MSCSVRHSLLADCVGYVLLVWVGGTEVYRGRKGSYIPAGKIDLPGHKILKVTGKTR